MEDSDRNERVTDSLKYSLSYRSSNGGMDENEILLTIIIGGGIILGIILAVRKACSDDFDLNKWEKPYWDRGESATSDTDVSSTPISSQTNRYGYLNLMSTYTQRHRDFNQAEFRAMIGNWYLKLLDARHEKNLDLARPFLAKNVYHQMSQQIKELREERRTIYFEKAAVSRVDLKGWYHKHGDDVIIVKLNTRMFQYTLKDDTGEIVKGSKEKEIFLEYEWTLIRSDEQGLETGQEINRIQCPACGAPIEIGQSAKCPYCDTIIMASQHSWVIEEIKGIGQW